jgi:Fur family transcriptional regulator, peroxide stress response regulator
MLNKTDHHRLKSSLAASGLRSTRQRHHVYETILKRRDHPTAEEVFVRVKEKMPDISFATVYNCLDTFVGCNLVKQVNMDRAPTRYCPNMHEHGHFNCEKCGKIVDIELPLSGSHIPLAEGFQVTRCEVSFQGSCPDCSGKMRVLAKS